MSFELMQARPHHGAMTSTPSSIAVDEVVIRRAFPEDVPALARLAALDSRRPIGTRALIAEHEGRPVAALSLEDGAVVADPFHPTADLVALLRLRAHALLQPARPRRVPVLRRRPALARG